jgi:N-acetylglutamate synthase
MDPSAERPPRGAKTTAPAGYALHEFAPGDYDPVLALWRATAGIGLNESDTREAIESFLRRNPGLSLVARDAGGTIVGAVLCGHDGRRGYLHHLAVVPTHRRRGIGRALVATCLENLRDRGIAKCNLFLYTHNAAGRTFWEHHGWAAREDLVVVQRSVR